MGGSVTSSRSETAFDEQVNQLWSRDEETIPLQKWERTGKMIRIFGVRHDDPGNEEKLLKLANSPVNPVFHEFASQEERGGWGFLIWCLATPPNALRLALNQIGDHSFDRECERAAHALAKREGVELRYLGVPRLQRAKWVFPLHTLVWAPTIAFLYAGYPVIGGFIATVILSTFASFFTRHHEHSIRERYWAEKIEDVVDDTDSPVVIVGDDHLRPLGNRLRERGFSVRGTSLHSILDED